jgi:hypothetical protein
MIFGSKKLQKPHINNAINKANKQLGRIKHYFKYLNEKTTILLYESLGRYILSMGLSYGVLSEKVQHRATKIGTLKRTRGDLI